jgi:CubicO group peptidase (beta-lactamase class C family)
VRLRIALALLALILPLGVRVAAAPCAPPAPDADWQVASPAAAGFEPAALCRALEAAARADANLHGFLVERGGRLVAELYREGPDAPINVRYGLGSLFPDEVAFGTDDLHDVRSVSKSVVALLYGIVAQEGALPALSSPVLAAFPELAGLRSEGREAITWEHLLTMSSGLAWHEFGRSPLTSDETRLFWKAEPLRFVFDRPLVAEPGTRFEYNSGGTTTLAELLVRTTGRPLAELAREKLFAPLGITRFEWATDVRDRPLAFTGLRLRPRDMAKLGRLVLAGGRWRGQQVVPEAWVAESLRPHLGTGVHGLSPTGEEAGYGYQWWTGRLASAGGVLPFAVAVGNGGQRIFVVPALDLTVVVTAGAYGEPAIARAINPLFEQVIGALAE